jgi:hypothetical protein
LLFYNNLHTAGELLHSIKNVKRFVTLGARIEDFRNENDENLDQ